MVCCHRYAVCQCDIRSSCFSFSYFSLWTVHVLFLSFILFPVFVTLICSHTCVNTIGLVFPVLEVLFTHQSDLFPACVYAGVFHLRVHGWACLSVYVCWMWFTGSWFSAVLHLGGLCITWLLSRDFGMQGRVRGCFCDILFFWFYLFVSGAVVVRVCMIVFRH